jgi:hypothetical protein
MAAATILVVEDDELMRELFRMHLGTAVYEASNRLARPTYLAVVTLRGNYAHD